MANSWTWERRTRQAELVHSWRPWDRSTGPRTKEGKERAARNSYKGGVRPALRNLARVLREQRKHLAEIGERHEDEGRTAGPA